MATDTQESSADIVADMRTKAECAKPYDDGIVMMLTDYADRLEAAHKRELSKICPKTGGDFGQLGDCAKLREALEKVIEIANKEWDASRETSAMWEIWEICKAALAAPARNCDMPLVVDGPADNNADKAWIVFKRHNPDAYFDVPGLLRCIDWLLGHATETEGGAE